MLPRSGQRLICQIVRRRHLLQFRRHVIRGSVLLVAGPSQLQDLAEKARIHAGNGPQGLQITGPRRLQVNQPTRVPDKEGIDAELVRS